MRKASSDDETDTHEYIERGRLLAKVTLRDLQMLFDDAVVKWAADREDLKSARLVMDIYKEAWLRGRVPDEERHREALNRISQHGLDRLDDFRKLVEQRVASAKSSRT